MYVVGLGLEVYNPKYKLYNAKMIKKPSCARKLYFKNDLPIYARKERKAIRRI